MPMPLEEAMILYINVVKYLKTVLVLISIKSIGEGKAIPVTGRGGP
jgi:hypothetical protein